MADERVFVRGDQRRTTKVPAAAVQLLADGWREVSADEPTEPFDVGSPHNTTDQPEYVDPPKPRSRKSKSTPNTEGDTPDAPSEEDYDSSSAAGPQTENGPDA